jgi:hypothetical protein
MPAQYQRRSNRPRPLSMAYPCPGTPLDPEKLIYSMDVPAGEVEEGAADETPSQMGSDEP